jgi:hypothetical protein
MKIKQILLGTVIAGLVALFTLSETSFAGDSKTVYPGTMGHEPQASGPYFLVHSQWGIHNTSPLIKTAILPVIHGKRNSYIKSAKVQVRDRHPAFDVSCRLWSVYTEGAVAFIEGTPSVSSVGASPNVQDLEFGELNTAERNGAAYSFRCFIPPSYFANYSGVYKYKVTEGSW